LQFKKKTYTNATNSSHLVSGVYTIFYFEQHHYSSRESSAGVSAHTSLETLSWLHYACTLRADHAMNICNWGQALRMKGSGAVSRSALHHIIPSLT